MVTGQASVASTETRRRATLQLYRVLIAVLSAFLLLLCITSLRWPFSWDHGIFAWIGDNILQGGMPYRDAWDTKGPLAYYTFAWVQWLLGKPMWGIRVFDLLLLAAAGIAVARIARELGGPGAGVLTALLFALQYLGSGYFETAQPDGWAGFLLVTSFVSLVRDEKRISARDLVISSLLVGTCVLLKPTYAAFLGVPLAYVFLASDLGFSMKLRYAALATTAFIVPTLVCICWFALRGALHSLIDTYVGYTMVQASIPVPGVNSSFHGTLSRFARRIYANPAIVCGCVASAAAIMLLWRDRPRSTLILVAGVIAGFFSVFVQQRYWNRYQWHPAYMPLTLLAGIGVGRLWHANFDQRWRSAARFGATGLGAALLVTMTPEPAREVYRWIQLRLGRISNEQYDAQFAHDSSTLISSRELAAYVRSHTRPDDRVLIWSDPLVNYLSGRAAPGRFAFHGGLNGPILTEYHQRYRREFLSAFDQNPPRIVAVGIEDLDQTGPYRPRNIGRQFPELLDRLLNDYKPVARFGDMEVYERTAHNGAADD